MFRIVIILFIWRYNVTTRDPHRVIREYYTYRGHTILIMHKHNIYFSYEWVIIRGKGRWSDPTFETTCNTSLIYAKEHVNQIINYHGKYYSGIGTKYLKKRHNKLKIHFRHSRYIKYGVYERRN